MLRLVVLVLLLANAAYFAWSQHLLAPWGIAPAQQSEPQRVAQQVKPQFLRILTAEEARRLDTAPATRGAECLQAGPLDESQVAALRQVLEPWPAGAWSLEPMVEPARWILYMGKYATPESVARKKAELRQLGVTFEPLTDPALEPGLSLGGYTSEAEAQRQREALAERGIRSAKVVQERAEVRAQLLRLPAVDDALRARLDELKAGLGAKSLRACR